jgi:hypothetical protein
MTPDEIIKTLEHCVSGQGCKTCPCRADGKPCEMSLRAILDAIHELTKKAKESNT